MTGRLRMKETPAKTEASVTGSRLEGAHCMRIEMTLKLATAKSSADTAKGATGLRP